VTGAAAIDMRLDRYKASGAELIMGVGHRVAPDLNQEHPPGPLQGEWCRADHGGGASRSA
jgi:hypothetical protein